MLFLQEVKIHFLARIHFFQISLKQIFGGNLVSQIFMKQNFSDKLIPQISKMFCFHSLKQILPWSQAEKQRKSKIK